MTPNNTTQVCSNKEEASFDLFYTLVMYVHFLESLFNYSCLLFYLLSLAVPPEIDNGPFIPQPPNVMPGNMTTRIGSNVCVVDGFDVTLLCNIVAGTRPITITWLRNGIPEVPLRGNMSTITVTDATAGDVFTCRADNVVGFDEETTTIYVFSK